MSPNNLTLQRLLITIYLFIGLLVPGSTLLLANKRKWAFAVPLLGVLWVGLISWTRWVITPTGFMVLLVGLCFLHMLSYVLSLNMWAKQNTTHLNNKIWGMFIFLCLLNLGIVVSCHSNKDKWFGFAFYHIPSKSMSPTLRTGDIVLIDSWTYLKQPPQVNDILITKREKNSLVLAKRLTKTRTNKNKTELFIEGDNQNRSVDSRRFGWIRDEYLIGRVEFVWFSFRETNRLFMPAN